MADMTVEEAEALGTAWMREANAEQELEATAEAAARALMRWVGDMGLIAAGASSVEEAMASAKASKLLLQDFERLEQLRHKLWLARKNFSDTVMPIALDIVRADGASEELLALTKKMLENAISAFARAHYAASTEDDERRVTHLAETMLALRAEVGEYSIADEQADYAFARQFIFGLSRPDPAPVVSAPTMTDEELTARLDALVA